MPNNATAGKTLFDAWEKRDVDAIAQHFAENVSFTDAPRQQEIKGRAAVRDWYASWATACPDGVAGANVVAASDDTVAVEGLYVGTNTGPFGPMAATGRSVKLPWTNILRFGSDGKIVGGAAYYDQLTLLTQLGHMQAPS
jgi:steroid delta-isomerase-like uncharacterized protein